MNLRIRQRDLNLNADFTIGVEDRSAKILVRDDIAQIRLPNVRTAYFFWRQPLPTTGSGRAIHLMSRFAQVFRGRCEIWIRNHCVMAFQRDDSPDGASVRRRVRLAGLLGACFSWK